MDRRQIDLGYAFRDPHLLEQALTHSSFANEKEGVLDNEQLEFLGDSVLGLITGEHLFKTYPRYGEGELSKLRAHLVSTRFLAKVARHLHIGSHVKLGRGEDLTGGRRKEAILADTMEALIAVLYIDGGLEAARRFVVGKLVEPELSRMGPDPAARTARTDHKSTLQEVLQSQGKSQPEYEIVAENGPEHAKTFTVQIRIGERVVRADGNTKKLAEQRAAELALAELAEVSE